MAGRDRAEQNRMKESFARKKEMQEPIRLNKYLAQAGICSRRGADRLIDEGQVTVDGQTAQRGQMVDATSDVRVQGQRAGREKELILLAFHKPRGVVCTTDKKWNDTTVEDVIRYPKRVFTVGRLDKESEGLLLLTNDGDLQDRIMRGANRHEKEYLVTVDRALEPAFLKRMAAGVYLKELQVKTRPCKVEKTGARSFRIILTQGLNRQIRRMCSELGYQVRELRRVRVMNIRLDSLPAGAYREVTDAEMEALYDSLQGKERERGDSKKSNG